jgi:hypothetical protein
MPIHPAIHIFRAVLDEILQSQPDWKACSLNDVKQRFVAHVRRQRQACSLTA